MKRGKIECLYLIKQNSHSRIFCTRLLKHSPDAAAKEWEFELVGQQQQHQQEQQQGAGMALPGMELALSNSFGFGGVNVSLLFRRCT